MVIGLIIMTIAYTSLGGFQFILSPIALSLLLLLYGLGGGFFLPSNTSAIMGSVLKMQWYSRSSSKNGSKYIYIYNSYHLLITPQVLIN